MWFAFFGSVIYTALSWIVRWYVPCLCPCPCLCRCHIITIDILNEHNFKVMKCRTFKATFIIWHMPRHLKCPKWMYPKAPSTEWWMGKYDMGWEKAKANHSYINEWTQNGLSLFPFPFESESIRYEPWDKIIKAFWMDLIQRKCYVRNPDLRYLFRFFFLFFHYPRNNQPKPISNDSIFETKHRLRKCVRIQNQLPQSRCTAHNKFSNGKKISKT